MNLLYKLLPDFLKKLFYPAIYNEPENFDFLVYDSKFKKEPCRGNLEITDHCKGCRYEKEHVG